MLNFDPIPIGGKTYQLNEISFNEALSDFVPLPVLSESSKSWTSHLLSTAQNLSSHCKMSLFDALSLPVSFEADYYASDAWDERKKEIEIEAQRHNALFKLGNEVIKCFNNMSARR